MQAMEQQPVLAPLVVEHTVEARVHWPSLTRWMRHFFAAHISRQNAFTVDMQRRAVWIGVALVLQSINEIKHSFYYPFLGVFASLIPFVLILGSFYALFRAFRTPEQSHVQVLREMHGENSSPSRFQRWLLIVVVLLTIGGILECGYGLILSVLPPQFSNDGTSLDTNAAILLLEGHNPYTDSTMIGLARRFPIQPEWTTPLRVGQFAHRLDYPSQSDLQSTLDTDLKAGSMPEFESKVSYPALSFLTLVPFALVKDYNVLPFYLLSYAALVLLGWRVIQPAMRPWLLVFALANVPMWTSTTGGNLDVFTTLLLVGAWLWREKRWTSALLFGLALASKQTAWFLIPFYAILMFRQYGWREVVSRLSIATLVFLVFNLPFMLWDFHAWLAGVLAPISDPMFPLGVGLVGLSTTHLIPYLPQSVYTALEGIAMLGSLAWYWRICRAHPEAALLLAVMPLFFAWRSLPSYFYCAAFPIFILMAARHNQQSRKTQTAHNQGQAQGTAPTLLDEAHRNKERPVYGRGCALCLPVRTFE